MKSPRIPVAELAVVVLWMSLMPPACRWLLFFVSLCLATTSCQPAGALYDDMRYRSERAHQAGKASEGQLWAEVCLVRDMVGRGRYGRRIVRPMTPRYLTVHSTQNYDEGADALRHALALKRGSLRSARRRYGNRIGYLIWHYTVDERMAVQHMPTYEQGEHADFSGPGNRFSIGIEMCENKGGDLARTVDRTAKLCALLMKRHGIPLENVVPHYHWPRYRIDPPRKDCPHFLLDDGRPGARWRLFLQLVDAYSRRLES